MEKELENKMTRELAGFMQAWNAVKDLKEQYNKTNDPTILEQLAKFRTLADFCAAYVQNCVK